MQAKINLDLHLDPEINLDLNLDPETDDLEGSTGHAPSDMGGSNGHAPSAALTKMQQPLLDTTGTAAAAVTDTDALPAGPQPLWRRVASAAGGVVVCPLELTLT